jgi:hypothetical protein
MSRAWPSLCWDWPVWRKGKGSLSGQPACWGGVVGLLGAGDPDLHTFDQAELDRISAAVRAQLEGAAFEVAWAAGLEMTVDDWQQAVAWALGQTAP